jgi:hypothetical protein
VGELSIALLIGCVGLVLLLLVVLLTLPPIRRFRRATAELQLDTRGRVALLRQLVNARRRHYE